MNIGTLIALAAKRIFDEHEQRMGVRLSPVTLSAVDLIGAIKEARVRLGSKVYLVGSAPKVAAAEIDPRAYVAPDQRAAERATTWRNRVKVADKERLVYVSVETHAKASGLRDCLEQLREQDLRAAFKVWASSPKSGLPSGLVAALDEAELLGQVRLAVLCEFAAKVAGAGAKGAAAWQAVGEALPTINLARDSRLGKEDTADRLRANHALIRALETGESRRRSASGPLAPVEDALHTALTGTAKSGRRDALASVDLGEIKTVHLAKGKLAKPKLTVAPEKKSSKGNEDKTSGKVTEPKQSGRDKSGEAKTPKGPSALPDAQAIAPDSPVARALSDTGKVAEPQPARGNLPKPSSRAVRLHGPPLPQGLATLLTRLLEGDGSAVELTVREADRSHLRDLAKTLSPEVREARRVRAKLDGAFNAWADARRALIDAARADQSTPPLADLLTRGMSSLLKEAAFKEAFMRFVAAATALYSAAGESDERTMREALSLDTLAVRSQSGDVALRVIGPLHLLSLGQTRIARDSLDESNNLHDNARRLIARALEVAPAAPGVLPDESGDLPIARGESGLLVYERVPELVPANDATAAARAVTARYLALCPHATLGLRVAVEGDGDITPLVEGVATAALETTPRPEGVEALCTRPPEHAPRSMIARAIEEGVLRLGALDERGAHGAHLTLRFSGVSGRPEDDEAAAPAVKTFAPPGGGRTTFDLRPYGLRVRTSVRGAHELEAVEALVALATGHVPQGAFIADVAGRSLRSECEGAAADGGWLAIIGPSIGRRPPAPWFLIAHEQFGARTTCAVVARDVRPAARSLQEGLLSLGVSDMRPRSLLLLAERLADAGRSALVPLVRPAASLVAGGLLALELRRTLIEDADPLIAPVTGAVYETLVGHPESGDGDTLILAASRTLEGLQVAIGYGTVASSPDLDTSKVQFDGAIAKRIARVAEAISAAADDKRPDAAAAREALGWAFWGAVAADDTSYGTWHETLTAWSREAASVTLADSIILVPPNTPAGKERTGKIGRVRTTVRMLAVERLNALVLGGSRVPRS